MQSKLILNLTALPAGKREVVTSLVLFLLLKCDGFTWAGGSTGPLGLDSDAIVVNHPSADSPKVLLTYKNGRFDATAQAKENQQPDTTIFDASKFDQLKLFLTGTEYLAGLHAQKNPSPVEGWADRMTTHESSMVEDHLARPLGWSNRGTSDPVYTFEMEGVRVSVCKHVALMTIPKEKGQPSADTTRRLEAEALKVRKEKFGF